MSNKLKWNLITVAIVLALWFVAYTLLGLDVFE